MSIRFGDVLVNLGFLCVLVQLSEGHLALAGARRRNAQFDKRRHRKAEALGNRLQVERVYVVHGLHAVAGVGSHVGFVRLLAAHVQKVVLLNQLLQLMCQ